MSMVVPSGMFPLFPTCSFLSEEACVVLLLHHNERDPWLIVLFQLYAGLSDGQELMVESLLKVALGDAISVEDDANGLKTCRFCRTE